MIERNTKPSSLQRHMRWRKCQKKWRVLPNHFSIELDDSRLLQFNVHLVWFSKQKTKHNTAFPKQMRFFMPLSEFSIERLADLSISMYHAFCWNPFKGNWHNGKVLHFAFRSQHGPENRVLGGWQDKFVWDAQDVNPSTTIDGYPFCTCWGWFLSLCEDRCFLHQRCRKCKILFARQQNSSLQRLHLWCEISWNFHSIQPHSIRVWAYFALHLVESYGINVGKYTSPMDAMGTATASHLAKSKGSSSIAIGRTAPAPQQVTLCQAYLKITLSTQGFRNMSHQQKMHWTWISWTYFWVYPCQGMQ